MADRCILCAVGVDDLEAHIAERHSDPTPHEREFEGTTRAIPDGEWIRLNRATRAHGESRPSGNAVAPIPTVLEAVGVRLEDVPNVEPEVDAGASCSEHETKRVFEAVDSFAGWRVDRAHFLVSFIDWGIRTSFSEELAEAGGWTIRSAATAGDHTMFARASELHAAIRDYLGNAGTGRDFTFRRLGRTFGKVIPTLMAKNPSLARYMQHGSDASNRLGVAPAYVLATTSIFDSIKPYAKWSDDELAAWRAHNASVRKVARDSRRRPEDLRPDPESASRSRDSGYSDWSQRLGARYGKGPEFFHGMLSGEGVRGPGDRRGLGFED